MNDMKPEDVMRAPDSGRYIDADKLWNNRPKMPNANAYGTYHDGFFDCMDKFSGLIRKAIDEECVSKGALALLRDQSVELNKKDAEIERLEQANKNLVREVKAAHIVIKNLEGDKEVYRQAFENARSKAITEFAERVKASMNDVARWKMHGDENEYFIIGKPLIDQIAKEMQEGEG